MKPQLATVTQLRDTPSLMDIAGWLRRKAQEVESGELDAETLLLVTMSSQGEVQLACYGVNPTRAEVVGMLHMAASERCRASNEIDD